MRGRYFCGALVALVMAGVGVAPAQTAGGTRSDSPRVAQPRPVQMENGRVQGFLTADAQVIAYKGIPYAQSPVDELRWRPPMQIYGKWKKVLYARDFGAHCLQSREYADMVFRDSGPSEDCLTLNVWAPAATAAAKPAHKGADAHGLPVMVWIYGGVFASGGTSEARQDGEALARRGVIVVSMNYRLGIFGFFSLPELAEEDPHHASGNYGLMDQAAAIAWVHRNIAAFGGDPGNVTIFGEDAGSESVSMQMASPVAKTLFARAIGESGAEIAADGPAMPTLAQAGAINAAWATRVLGSSKLFYLRQLPADEILAAALSRTQPAPKFGPIVDGYFLPDTMQHLYADGKQAHVALLAGWNADEQHAQRPVTAESFVAQLREDFGERLKDALTVYPMASDAELVSSADAFAGDRAHSYGVWAWLEAQTRRGDAPVYGYRFELPNPGDRNHGAGTAFHSDDIEYVFGTLDSRAQMAVRPEDRALSEQMQQYWVNFARTGDPNGAGLPQWPRYALGGGYPVMHMNADSAAKADALRARYLFLDQSWASQAK